MEIMNMGPRPMMSAPAATLPPTASRPSAASGVDSVTFSGVRNPAKPAVYKLPIAILEPQEGSNIIAKYNPGAWRMPDGRIFLFVRETIGPKYPRPDFVSNVTLYKLRPDGMTVDSTPRTLAAPIGPLSEKFSHGFEDVRVTKIGREFFVVGTGYNGKVPQITLFRTHNLEELGEPLIIGPTVTGKPIDDKDAFFHPEKVRIGGKDHYFMYHRVSDTGNIQVAWADSIDEFTRPAFWNRLMQPSELEDKTIMRGKPGTWENKLGGGPPPLKTKDGWLFLYHASDSNGVYRMGAALLDLKDPRKVLHRAPDFIMEPELDYEKNGPVANVVFPQGNFIVENPRRPDDPEVYVYYGAADKNVGLATLKLNELLGYLKNYDADGKQAR